ncbi:hypothetical protein RFM98_14295 [Mesorhizobium sp. VK9D]|uniref:hypothetical protein n=1 Tax=Mesorhizobium australafricanum TaxID=3072311 RepID=UPI002A241416|nr:hypothetical protein [Mesorhizobium sp. VK9D]MDX8453931.1 hypothetical protein [Mesorhizobium sp. VK9D]
MALLDGNWDDWRVDPQDRVEIYTVQPRPDDDPEGRGSPITFWSFPKALMVLSH